MYREGCNLLEYMINVVLDCLDHLVYNNRSYVTTTRDNWGPKVYGKW